VAETPERAVELFRENGDSLCLLLSDVVMPGMSGPELYKALNGIKPGLKALFMSGYAADVLSDHASQDKLVEYIQKPFSKNELGFKLQEILSSR
jgi:DNA-binding NtrC family response regulator